MWKKAFKFLSLFMLVTVAGLPIANATLDEHQKLFTVSHTDSEYNSPFLGNGEV
ncbi:hypothetical protein GF337_13665, partial [candidate division KSB1 bacterium]|nr:hypothetical protein [candidate division KSB1 bacterium]